jgi:hypothetical protein
MPPGGWFDGEFLDRGESAGGYAYAITALFRDATLSERWAMSDTLAVWYSLGNRQGSQVD